MSTLFGFGQSLTPQSWISDSYTSSTSSRTSIASVLASAGSVLPIIATSKIRTLKSLGRGATFLVESASVEVNRDGVRAPVVVAVKRFREEVLKLEIARECAKREIEVLTHPILRQHPNIMQALGYGWAESLGKTEGSKDPFENAAPYMLVEMADYGTLRDFLVERKFTERGVEGLKDLAILLVDIAQGILVLHENKIVHGDVKLDNALVFAVEENKEGIKFRAKLADFGACIMETECAHRPYLGTERYNPKLYFDPEVGANVDVVEQYYKTDVYGFGFVIWECFLDGAYYVDDEDTIDAIRESFEELGSIEIISDEFLEELEEEKGFPKEYVELIGEAMRPCLEKEYWKRKSMKEVLEAVIELEDPQRFYDKAYKKPEVAGVEVKKSNFIRNYLDLPRIFRSEDDTLVHQNATRNTYSFRWQKDNTPAEVAEYVSHVRAMRCVPIPQAIAPGSARERGGDFDFFASQESVACELQSVIYAQLLLDSSSDSNPTLAARARLHLAYCYEIGFGTNPMPSRVLATLEAAAEDDWVAEALLANISAARDAETGSEVGLWQRIQQSQKAVVEHEAGLPFTCQGKTYTLDNTASLNQLLRTYKNAPSYTAQKLQSPIFIKVKLSSDLEETRSLVQHAARLGRFPLIRQLLSRLSSQPDLTPFYDDFVPGSVYAMEFGHKKAAEFLLDYNDYQCDSRGVTPLHWLFMFNSSDAKELAEFIALGRHAVRHMDNLDTRLRVDARPGYDALGRRMQLVEPVGFEEFGLKLEGTPLMWAVRVGCLHAVRILLELGADPDLEYGTLGARALDLAVGFHYPEITKLLLEHGASFKNSAGWTALHHIPRVTGNTSIARQVIHGDRKAVRQAFKETLQVLLAAGLSLSAENKEGKTPLVDLTSHGILDCDIYLLEELLAAGSQFFPPGSKDNTKPLVEATMTLSQLRTNFRSIRFILSSLPGLDINAFNSYGMAAIHHCALFNSPTAISILESSSDKFDINLLSVKEPAQPAIMHAAMFGRTEALQALFELGAKTSGVGWNVLETAVMHRHMDIIHFLLEEGMDVKTERILQDKELGEVKVTSTVLHYASASDRASSSLVKPLLQKYPKKMKPLINIQDSTGWTPLHRAANYADLEAVETLLNYGAEPGIKADGKTALDIVSRILKRGPGGAHERRTGNEVLRREFMGNLEEIRVLLIQAMEE